MASFHGQLKALEGKFIYDSLIKGVNTLENKTIPVKKDILDPRFRNN